MAVNYIYENMNPKNKDEDDCVLRAITRLEIETMTYEDVLENMKKLNVKEFEDQKNAYCNPFVFSKLLTNLGYVRFKTKPGYMKTRYSISTVNMASLMSKEIDLDIFALTNTHAVAVLKDGSFSDTWNSGRRHTKEFYLKPNVELEELFKDHKIEPTIDLRGKTYETIWFERMPNGTVNIYNEKQIIAKFKNGERIS